MKLLNKQRGYYNIDLSGVFLFFIVVGVLIGIAIALFGVYAVPWLWHLIKPFLMTL